MKTGKGLIRLMALTLVFALLLGSSAMAGWQIDGGKWWYSFENGSYAKNQWVKDGGDWYYFGNDGYMVRGWQKINGNWYYLNDSGKMATGWVKKGQNRYYMNSDGVMLKGWQRIRGIWYYLDEETGAAATGWKKIGGDWYYFDKDGRMFSNAYIDKKYFVDENGKWDGITIGDIPDNPSNGGGKIGEQWTTLVFYQNGWYVARLAVEYWDGNTREYHWVFSDSCCKGGSKSVNVETGKYKITRVGYQIWAFGWDSMYEYKPWANMGYATSFTLAGYGDHPEFTWE